MKIFINGGLGNQLFQYAYSHIKANNIEVYLDFSPRADRPFELQKLIELCKHNTKISKTNEFLLKTRIKISRFSEKLPINLLSNLFFKVAKIRMELNPFTPIEDENIDENMLHLGYFQHWKNVENSWDLFGSEIISYLKTISIKPDLQFNPLTTILMHIRQGDLINVKETMGVIDSSYYSNGISIIQNSNNKVDFKIVVLTDDVIRAKEVVGLEKLKNVFIYGPNELTAWQTLKMMSDAKFFICANSTLSWWGAYLSSKKGSVCILPEPWFKNWHEQVGDAFYFPGSIRNPSYFL